MNAAQVATSVGVAIGCLALLIIDLGQPKRLWRFDGPLMLGMVFGAVSAVMAASGQWR